MCGGGIDYGCARGLRNLSPRVGVMSRRKDDCGCVKVGSMQMQMAMERMWGEKIWEMSQECSRMKRCGGAGVERL